MKLRFTPEHLAIFAEISGDRNPLHLNSDYARRSPFGEVVVYGVASVLASLGAWAKQRPFVLKKIRAQFLKPLYLNTDYRIEFIENGESVAMNIFEGFELRSKTSFSWNPTEHKPDSGNALQVFNLLPNQIPRHQFKALCWSSYYVGMVQPGKQALFSDLEMHFDSEAQALEDRFEPEVTSEYDDRFRQFVLRGNGPGLKKFEIRAFERPELIKYTDEEIRRYLPHTRFFSNQRVLISGGSRGLGLVLSRCLAFLGTDIAVNYRKPTPELEELSEMMRSQGREFVHLSGDLGNSNDRERFRAEIQKRWGTLDLLVNNAFPAIRPVPYGAAQVEFLPDYVYKSLMLSHALFREFLPLMKTGSPVLSISTDYLKSPPAEFSHYTAAKGAMEGLCIGLSREFPKLKFLTARLPKILTDQTNVAFDRVPAKSAPQVAGSILKSLTQTIESGGASNHSDLAIED